MITLSYNSLVWFPPWALHERNTGNWSQPQVYKKNDKPSPDCNPCLTLIYIFYLLTLLIAAYKLRAADYPVLYAMLWLPKLESNPLICMKLIFLMKFSPKSVIRDLIHWMLELSFHEFFQQTHIYLDFTAKAWLLNCSLSDPGHLRCWTSLFFLIQVKITVLFL